MNYLSLFSGIGGFEQGMIQACAVKKKELSASDSLKSINLPFKFINNTSQHIKTGAILQKLTHSKYQGLTLLLADFRVRHSQLPEKDRDLLISEAAYFLKSLGLSGKSNHAFYCLKTSRGFYLTIKGKHSIPSSPRLMNWGMTVNGRCLTARITAWPKTGSACSLSAILEAHPAPKYFLSEKAKKNLLEKQRIKGARKHSPHEVQAAKMEEGTL